MNPKLKLTFGKHTVELTAEEVRELRKKLAEFDDGQKAAEVAELNKRIRELEKQKERIEKDSYRPYPVPNWVLEPRYQEKPYQPIVTCKS